MKLLMRSYAPASQCSASRDLSLLELSLLVRLAGKSKSPDGAGLLLFY